MAHDAGDIGPGWYVVTLAVAQEFKIDGVRVIVKSIEGQQVQLAFKTPTGKKINIRGRKVPRKPKQ